MTREELIEQRKGMSNEDVIKAVIRKMAEDYGRLYVDARSEYKELMREGDDEVTIEDVREIAHDFSTSRNLLDALLDTLDERCSAYVNGIEY